MRKIITSLFALAFSVSSALAGGTLTLMGIGAGQAVSLPSAEFVASAQNTTNATTHTFTDLAIGAADATRYVYIAVHMIGAAPSSVTIGGSAGTLVACQAGSSARVCFYYRAIASGTTATVVVTHAANINNVGVASWRVINLNSPTPTASNFSASSPASYSVTPSTGGVIIGGSSAYISSSTVITNVWTGITEQYDVRYLSATDGAQMSGAVLNNATGSSVAITDTWLNTPTSGNQVSYAIALR
jgi:hypothetical protein